MTKHIISDPWIYVKGHLFKRSCISQICIVDGPEKFRYIRMVLNIEGKSSPAYIELEYDQLEKLLDFLNNPSDYRYMM